MIMNTQELDMNKLFNLDGLPGTFEGETITYEPLQLVEVESHPDDRKQDLMDDYALARQTNHFQNQMMMDAAKIALELAKNSDSPRHLQAFTALMQQINTSNKEMLALHKEMKKITDEKVAPTTPAAQPQMNIENATVFVGSPSDLMDQLEDEEEGLLIEGETA